MTVEGKHAMHASSWYKLRCIVTTLQTDCSSLLLISPDQVQEP
jgi:hypothetical protein